MVIIGVVVIRLRIRNDINRLRRSRLDIRNRRWRGRGRNLGAVGIRIIRLRRGLGGCRHPAVLAQHGVDDAIGHSLLLQVKDLVRVQAIGIAGILNVIDDDILADVGVRELHDF